jgi:hypothetical protein
MAQAPFTTTLEVLERHKLRLPLEVYGRIPFLASAPQKQTATAVPGQFGGIQVIAGELPLARLRTRLVTLSDNGKATAERAGEAWTLLARYVSNAWDVTFSFYENRYTAVLPSVARDLGLVPKKGQEALIFIYGDIFEIWRTDAWNALNGSMGPRIELLEADLEETGADSE